MNLAAAATVAGLTFIVVVKAGAGLGVFVPGCITVTTQFIFMIASLLHDGRPRMAGPGVSAIYQWELILWVRCQGYLAARQWGHRVCHIGVYEICYKQ